MSSMIHVLPILIVVVFASAMFLHSDVTAAHPTSEGLHKTVIHHPNVDPALASICKKTSYPDVCISTIAPLLKGRKADPTVALKAEIEATTVRVGTTKQVIDKLAANPATSKSMKDCLDVCTENYDDALDSLQGSVKAIDGHDHGTLTNDLSALLTYIETCNDVFDEIPGVESPIAVSASQLSKLGSNCLAIAQQVQL